MTTMLCITLDHCRVFWVADPAHLQDRLATRLAQEPAGTDVDVSLTDGERTARLWAGTTPLDPATVARQVRERLPEVLARVFPTTTTKPEEESEMTTTRTRVTFRAGAPWHAGTAIPINVTGECPHRHRTPEGARKCIQALDRAIKSGHGPGAYADRVVMAEERLDGCLVRRWVWQES